MLSSMMNRPLLISSLIDHAARYHADTEIVSRTIEGGSGFELHRTNYGETAKRAKRLANALARLAWRARRPNRFQCAHRGRWRRE